MYDKKKLEIFFNHNGICTYLQRPENLSIFLNFLKNAEDMILRFKLHTRLFRYIILLNVDVTPQNVSSIFGLKKIKLLFLIVCQTTVFF